MKWTPNDIEILLHYHVSAAVHPRADAPAVRDATLAWVQCGCLEGCDSGYTTTAKGAALIQRWQNTPLPVQTWT